MNIDTIINKYAGEKGSLIAVLQEAQELNGWLSSEQLDYIADKTGVPKAKVMGAVTFYTQFRLTPPGKHTVQLCQGTACHVNGSAEVDKHLREYLATVPEGEFSCDNVACLGCCSLSPVMTVDGKTYGHLTGDTAVKILKEIV